nr:DUF1413 domain-containing protein [uncultured Catonella sp.]
MKKNFEITLQINAELDVATQEVNIISCTVVPINRDKALPKHTHRITNTEHKYKILTLGSKFAKTYGMKLNEQIHIYVNNELYPHPVTTHKSTLGRIDGLTDVNRYFGIFLENYERTHNKLKDITISVYYDTTKKELQINTNIQSIYSAGNAVKRAISKFTSGKHFTISDLYTQKEWSILNHGEKGIIGKNFYTYIKSSCQDIVFNKFLPDKTAQYTLK